MSFKVRKDNFLCTKPGQIVSTMTDTQGTFHKSFIRCGQVINISCFIWSQLKKLMKGAKTMRSLKEF